TGEPPDIDFTAKDGVRHTSWIVSDDATIAAIEAEFASIPFLYIADGHHRSAAAARVFQSRNGAGRSGRFLAVIFPHDQMQILPYNRVLKDLNGHAFAPLFEKLDGVFVLRKNSGVAQPERTHQLALFLDKAWHTL